MGVFGLGIRLRLAQAGGPMLGLVLRTHLPKHNHHKIRFHFQLDQEVILEAVICCWCSCEEVLEDLELEDLVNQK